MKFDPAIYERILQTYEALGLGRDSVGLWCLPLRDAEVLVEHLHPQRHRRILEVGTYVGVSTMLLALHAPRAVLHSVDPNLPLAVGTPGCGADSARMAKRRTLAIAAEAAGRLGVADRISFYSGGFAVGGDFQSRVNGGVVKSAEPGEPEPRDGDGSAARPRRPRRKLRVVGPTVSRREGPFDLVFIDGLHYHDAVQADLELAVAHCAPGGMIVLHDLVGLWGAQLRWATHRFIERHPEFVLRHEPYCEIYQAVGSLVRRSEVEPGFMDPHPARLGGMRLVDEPRWRRHLLASTWREKPRGAVIEILPEGGQSLREDAVALGAREVHSLEVGPGRLDACLKRLDRLPSSRSELVSALGALDVLPDEEAATLLSALARRGGTLLLGLTPPGERGSAELHSRTLPRNLALLHDADLRVVNDLTLDLEPFLLPYWSGAARQSSHLLHLVTVARRARRGAMVDTGYGIAGARGSEGGGAAVESRQLGILFRDLLMQHVLGKMPPPRMPSVPAPREAPPPRALPRAKGKHSRRKRRAARKK